MKKNNISFLLIIFITIFTLNVFISTPKAAAITVSNMNISQFVELMISLGVVPTEKVAAARAMISTLSQAPVTVSTSTSYVQVLTPNGAESWDIDLDVPYTVTWGSAGLTQARVALVSTSKKPPVCELTPTPVTSKNGNNSFSIKLKTANCYNLTTGTSTPLTDGVYKARVYYTDSLGKTISDESNATFKITPKLIPSLKVTYPNGAEQLIRNQEYAIKYTLTNEDESTDGLIYYYLLDNNGNIANNGHKALRNKTFDLELPSSLSAGAYKLKLKLTTKDDRIELEDISDNFFWVSTGL